MPLEQAMYFQMSYIRCLASEQKYSDALRGLKALAEQIFPDSKMDRIAVFGKNTVKVTLQTSKMLFVLIQVIS